MLMPRDVIFDNRRHFRELLQGSEEGSRQHPQQQAQAARRGGPAHPGGGDTRAAGRVLTDRSGIQTLPVMVAMATGASPTATASASCGCVPSCSAMTATVSGALSRTASNLMSHVEAV
jgi:hypothetical protein